MTEIEKKALALLNASGWKGAYLKRAWNCRYEALCRAVEAHEAFKREVSEAVERYCTPGGATADNLRKLKSFVITKPVDPLVEVMGDFRKGSVEDSPKAWADYLRAALAARGLEVRKIEGDA